MFAALSARFRSWWRLLRAGDNPATSAFLTPAPVVPERTEEQTPVVPAVALEPATVEAADSALRAQTLEVLQKLQQIPALQSLAQGFLRAATQADGSVEDVVAAVEKDPALCMRVLRLANSAFVNPEKKIEDIFTAVQMLGMRRVSALAQALFTMRDARNMAGGLDWRHLWIHALATAAIAEELEQRLGRPAGQQLYMAALLHDVGKIVLSTVAPEIYSSILEEVLTGTRRLDVLERERFGVGHAEAGVIFARLGHLPDEVIAAMAHHASPAEAPTHRRTVAIVNLANFMSKAHGLGFSGARLDETDGDFVSLPGWAVIAEEDGGNIDPAMIEEDMRPFISGLKQELVGLGEAT
jgi:putative nucleotidyltransferase with HDIG domain